MRSWNKYKDRGGNRAGLRARAVCGVCTPGTLLALRTLQMLDLLSVKARSAEGLMEVGPVAHE